MEFCASGRCQYFVWYWCFLRYQPILYLLLRFGICNLYTSFLFSSFLFFSLRSRLRCVHLFGFCSKIVFSFLRLRTPPLSPDLQFGLNLFPLSFISKSLLVLTHITSHHTTLSCTTFPIFFSLLFILLAPQSLISIHTSPMPLLPSSSFQAFAFPFSPFFSLGPRSRG